MLSSLVFRVCVNPAPCFAAGFVEPHSSYKVQRIPSLSRSQTSASLHNSSIIDSFLLEQAVDEDSTYQHPAWMYENITDNERIPLLTVTTAPNGNLVEMNLEVTPLRLSAASKVFLKLVFSMRDDLHRAQNVLKRVETADGIGTGLYLVSLLVPVREGPGVELSPPYLKYERRIQSVELSLEYNDDLNPGASALHFVGEFQCDGASRRYQLVLETKSRLFGSGWIEPLESI
jgi:hypothetical protein